MPLAQLVGAKAEAIRDYTAAVARDPEMVAAYLNRGMACLELRRYPEALADFAQVARLGRDAHRRHSSGVRPCQRLDSVELNGLGSVAHGGEPIDA